MTHARTHWAAAGRHLPAGDITSDTWTVWTDALKAATGRKGGGLFMPLRKAITGYKRGPDMASILPLIGRERILRRLG